MEINGITPLVVLVLAFVLPEFKLPLIVLAALLAVVPYYISEFRRAKYDKTATKILLHVASISDLNESKIASLVSKFEGYAFVGRLFERTGRLQFPNYGRRSRNLAVALRSALKSGSPEALAKATENAIKSEALESELQGLISGEKYTLILTSITSGAILGIVNTITASPLLLYYAVAQSCLSALWLFFISGRFFESFSFLPPLVIAAFYFASRFA